MFASLEASCTDCQAARHNMAQVGGGTMHLHMSHAVHATSVQNGHDLHMRSSSVKIYIGFLSQLHQMPTAQLKYQEQAQRQQLLPPGTAHISFLPNATVPKSELISSRVYQMQVPAACKLACMFASWMTMTVRVSEEAYHNITCSCCHQLACSSA